MISCACIAKGNKHKKTNKNFDVFILFCGSFLSSSAELINANGGLQVSLT